MKIYTLWHKGSLGDPPWIMCAVDEPSLVSNPGFPAEYLETRDEVGVRELILNVSEEVVRALFAVPSVAAVTLVEDEP